MGTHIHGFLLNLRFITAVDILGFLDYGALLLQGHHRGDLVLFEIIYLWTTFSRGRLEQP